MIARNIMIASAVLMIVGVDVALFTARGVVAIAGLIAIIAGMVALFVSDIIYTTRNPTPRKLHIGRLTQGTMFCALALSVILFGVLRGGWPVAIAGLVGLAIFGIPLMLRIRILRSTPADVLDSPPVLPRPTLRWKK